MRHIWLVGGLLLGGATTASAQPPVEQSAIYAGTVVLHLEHEVEVVGIGWEQDGVGLGAVGIRERPTDGFWVDAGVGAANQDLIVPAGMIGLGFNITPSLELSVHAGTGVGFDGTPHAIHASLGVGAKF